MNWRVGNTERWRGTEALLNPRRVAELLRPEYDRDRPGTKVRDDAVWDDELLNHLVGLVIVPLLEENWGQVVVTIKEWYRLVNARRRRLPLTMVLELPLTCTQIGVRTQTYLERAGYETVGDLVRARRDRLMEIPQFGPQCLEEVIAAMRALGFDPEGRYVSQNDASGRGAGVADWQQALLDHAAAEERRRLEDAARTRVARRVRRQTAKRRGGRVRPPGNRRRGGKRAAESTLRLRWKQR